MTVYHGSIVEIKNPDVNHSNDDVFKSVDMYRRGIWDKQRTLQELKYFKKNNQIAIINQTVIDDLLIFSSSYEVEDMP